MGYRCLNREEEAPGAEGHKGRARDSNCKDSGEIAVWELAQLPPALLVTAQEQDQETERPRRGLLFRLENSMSSRISANVEEVLFHYAFSKLLHAEEPT